MDDRPPLRETGAHIAVFSETIPETVEPLSDRLSGRARKGLRAGVDLDAGKDALAFKNLGERRAAGTLLADRFVIHDGAADEFGGARRGKEHFPVGAPALLGRLDSERVESLRQRWDGFVGRENPFSVGNQTLSNALETPASSCGSSHCFFGNWNNHGSIAYEF